MSFQRRLKFGDRTLTEESNIYAHNAWDDVAWNVEMQENAEMKVKLNSEQVVPMEEQGQYDVEASRFWDEFYQKHKTGFFKDRHWLFTEFPELSSHSTADSNKTDENCTSQPTDIVHVQENTHTARKIILEVGCGAGNSVFPIIEACEREELYVYCCDFSEVAISLVKTHPNFDCQKCQPFVLDLTSECWDVPFSACSLDYILLVFVLSALHPDKMKKAIKNLVGYLKPGGKIFFRDYGRYDMVELRFKPGHCLSEHCYVRGDGTRVYFFSEEEVHEMFNQAGLIKRENKIDRRLQVNRGKLLTMYRIWIQAAYEKPLED